jgi:hypothetical protein
MRDSRDVRSRASEVKFLVSAELGNGVRVWARQHLERDPYGSGSFGDEYRTASVYFDTDALDVFHRRGSYGRSKYRVRRYGDAGVVFLERKLREPGLVVKRRTTAPLVSLGRLNGQASEDPWPGQWFERRISARALRPVCQVSYQRTARCLSRNGEAIRLTLDESVSVAPVTGPAFVTEAGTRVLNGHMILELKFRNAMPALFKRLVEDLALEPRRVSKYRCGMVALANGRLPIDDGTDIARHA